MLKYNKNINYKSILSSAKSHGAVKKSVKNLQKKIFRTNIADRAPAGFMRITSL